jgi:hypothetical protein
MPDTTSLGAADIYGLGRLAADAALGLTDLVEAAHHAIAARIPGAPTPPRGIPGLVYGSIRGISRAVGGSLDALLAPLAPPPVENRPPRYDDMLAALNGVVGDRLAASGSPLAERMQLRQGGRPLNLASLAQPSGKILLMVHGLCLNDRHWRRNGHDHGERLAAELGYTPIYLRYNTGLHISANGRALADLLEDLLREWPAPVEELAIVAHSMGGLVARSACHYGSAACHSWPQRLRRLVFLGTPHHGAPLERHGNKLQSLLGASHYTAAYARLGQLRSSGITDLRYGSLLDEDWAGSDRFAHARDTRRPVPLPVGVQCYAIAASTARADGDLRGMLLGDGLVPHASALGDHPDPELALAFPAERRWIGYDMHHLDLLDRADVYEQLRQWLGEG